VQIPSVPLSSSGEPPAKKAEMQPTKLPSTATQEQSGTKQVECNTSAPKPIASSCTPISKSSACAAERAGLVEATSRPTAPTNLAETSRGMTTAAGLVADQAMASARSGAVGSAKTPATATLLTTPAARTVTRPVLLARPPATSRPLAAIETAASPPGGGGGSQKRRICPFYGTVAKCQKGKSCRDIHDLSNLPCWHYQRGHCSFGARCLRRHDY
jgi:hypothetical protein